MSDKKFDIKDISPLTLRDITIDDDLQEFMEKTNFNFDQILQFTDSQFAEYITNQVIVSIASGEYNSIINNGDTTIQYIGKPGATGPAGIGIDGRDGSQIYAVNDVVPNYSSLLTPNHKEGDIIIDGTSMMSKVIKIVDDNGNDKLVYANQFRLNQSIYTALVSEKDYFSDGIETDHFIIYDDAGINQGSNNLIFATKEDLASLFYKISIGIDHDIDDIYGSLNVANIPIKRSEGTDPTFTPQVKLKYRRNWVSGLSSNYMYMDYRDVYDSNFGAKIVSQRFDLWNSANAGITIKNFIEEEEQYKNTIFGNSRNIKFVGNVSDVEEGDYGSYLLIRIDDIPSAAYDEVSKNPTTQGENPKPKKEVLIYSNQHLRIEVGAAYNIEVGSKTTFNKAVTIESTLEVNGTSTFDDMILREDHTFTAEGNSTFNGTVDINGVFTITGKTTYNADVTFNKRAEFNQGVHSDHFYALNYENPENPSTYFFDSTASFEQYVTFKKGLESLDDVRINKKLSVVGLSTLNGGIKTGVIDALAEGGSITVKCSLNLEKTLKVEGASTFNDKVSINNSLDVTTGILNNGTLSNKGVATFDNKANFNSDIYVGNIYAVDREVLIVTIKDNLTVEKNLVVNGSLTLGKELKVDRIEAATSGGSITAASKFLMAKGINVTYGQELKYGTYDIYHQNNLNLLTVDFSAKNIFLANGCSIYWNTESAGNQKIVELTAAKDLNIGNTIVESVHIVAKSGGKAYFNNDELTTRTIVNNEYARKGFTITISNKKTGTNNSYSLTGNNIVISHEDFGLPSYGEYGEYFLGRDGEWHWNYPIPDWKSRTQSKSLLGYTTVGGTKQVMWEEIENFFNFTPNRDTGSYSEYYLYVGYNNKIDQRRLPNVPVPGTYDDNKVLMSRSSGYTYWGDIPSSDKIYWLNQNRQLVRNRMTDGHTTQFHAGGDGSNRYSLCIRNGVATLYIQIRSIRNISFQLPKWALPRFGINRWEGWTGYENFYDTTKLCVWADTNSDHKYAYNTALCFNYGKENEGGDTVSCWFEGSDIQGINTYVTWTCREENLERYVVA